MAFAPPLPLHGAQKNNCEWCYHLKFSDEAIEELKRRYHEVYEVPRLLNDILHLNLESLDVKFFAACPEVIQWSDDGGFLMIPNYPYIADYVAERPDISLGDLLANPEGLALSAWCIHPRLLANSVFSDPENRLDFRRALAMGNQGHARAEGPIRNQEDEIPYMASVLDMTQDDVPLLQHLKVTAQQYMEQCFGTREDDYTRMFINTMIDAGTATLHLHMRINQRNHPMFDCACMDLDEVIGILESGRTIKDAVLAKDDYLFRKDKRDMLGGLPGVRTQKMPNPWYNQLFCDGQVIPMEMLPK